VRGLALQHGKPQQANRYERWLGVLSSGRGLLR
jgi:hypothetical protein